MNHVSAELYEFYQKYPVIVTDSRKVVPGSIFFALRGDHFDGNDFVNESLISGAALVITDREFEEMDPRIFKVENTLQTLQELATFHRQKLGLKVIAITGSNGKTTTKELIHRVLKKKYHCFATEGNLNNHIGVPLTLLSLQQHHEIAVVEMGANHPGEIAQLCEIAQPDYGLITNVGKAHLEGFGSFEGVVKAKTELYEFLRKTGGKIFINADNGILKKAATEIPSFSYGTFNADCKGEMTGTFPFIRLTCSFNDTQVKIQSQLIGKYNFENILAAVAIGNYFKVEHNDIREAIESYVPSNNRSQIIKTVNNTVIMDAYNANPDSMKASIENFSESEFEKKVLILGDMAELGQESENEHLAVLDIIRKEGFQTVFLIGQCFHAINKDQRITSFVNISSFSEYVSENPFKNCTLLLKGSRKMQLEKILSLL